MAQRQLRLKWNVPANCWMLDILDSGGVPLLTGLAVVTGADLLDQFAYLGLGGQILAQTDFDPDAVPTFDNLGTVGHLYFVTP